MKFLIKLKKCISIITASCLLISFVIGPTAANAMTNEEATKKYKQIFKDFMLPYNYGQITSAHYAGTDRVIINIQDLHCHPKVQKNISNIIETFDKSYGIKKVYLEGAYGQVSTKWLIDKLDNPKKIEMLDKMLETGRLTGAEYYSAMTGKANIINGLEEKGPYLDNLKRFGEIIENQEKINLILQAINEALFKLKQQYYTKRQYKLEELSNNYRDGKISSQKYYALLSKHIDKLGIDISKYENTFTYIMLLDLQKKLDYTKVTNELQNLVFFLRENLPNSAYQMLVDNTDNFSKLDKLYGYIVRISRQLNLDLTVNFPNLDNYFGYIEFSQKINPLDLITEEKKLTEEINTRFSDTKAQRDVVFLINFAKYLKDYVTSKITSDDYVYYTDNIDIYRQLWNKYVDNKVLSLLDEYIAEADKFYKINMDRNIYFTRNMFKEGEELNKIETEVEANGDVNKIIENMKDVKEVDIVITGGFHSQTVTEILKDHGVSYIVITPNVTEGTKLAEETYYQIAKEQSKISFQTLANLIASLSPIAQKRIFDALDKKESEHFAGLSPEERKELLRKIIAAKLSESDNIGNVIDEVLKEVSKYSTEGLDKDFFSKVKADEFRKLWDTNLSELKKVVNTLQLGAIEQSLILIGNTLEKHVSLLSPKQSQSDEEIDSRSKLESERIRNLAGRFADKLGIGLLGRELIGSFLAGILEFKPMLFGSTDSFVRMHYSEDKRNIIDISKDSRIKPIRILKGIFYATTIMMITLALTTPMSLGCALTISILSGIIPHQTYDFYKDVKIAKALKERDYQKVTQIQDSKLDLNNQIKTRVLNEIIRQKGSIKKLLDEFIEKNGKLSLSKKENIAYQWEGDWDRFLYFIIDKISKTMQSEKMQIELEEAKKDPQIAMGLENAISSFMGWNGKEREDFFKIDLDSFDVTEEMIRVFFEYCKDFCKANGLSFSDVYKNLSYNEHNNERRYGTKIVKFKDAFEQFFIKNTDFIDEELNKRMANFSKEQKKIIYFALFEYGEMSYEKEQYFNSSQIRRVEKSIEIRDAIRKLTPQQAKAVVNFLKSKNVYKLKAYAASYRYSYTEEGKERGYFDLLKEKIDSEQQEDKSDISADSRLSQRTAELTTTKNKEYLEKQGLNKDSKEWQTIMNKRENWKIVLSVLFPSTIGILFAKSHLTKEDKKSLTKDEKKQKISNIQLAVNTVIEMAELDKLTSIAELTSIAGFAKKISAFLTTMFSKEKEYEEKRQKLAEAHTTWNQPGTTKEVNPLYWNIIQQLGIDEQDKNIIKINIPFIKGRIQNYKAYSNLIQRRNYTEAKLRMLSDVDAIIFLYECANRDISLLKEMLNSNNAYGFVILLENGIDIKFLKSLDQDLFKALIQSSSPFNKVDTDKIKDFLFLLDKYNLKYTERRNLKIDLLVEYCFNNLDLNEKELNSLLSLADNLTERDMRAISLENDRLALKIFVNEKFNNLVKENLSEYFDINSIGVRYDIALDISREIARVIGKIDNSNFVNIDEMIEKVMFERYLPNISFSDKKVILGPKTNILSLFAPDELSDEMKKAHGLPLKRFFTADSLKYLLEGLGFNPNNPNYKYIERGSNKNAKKDFLKELSEIKEDTYVFAHMHGTGVNLFVSGAQNVDQENLSVEEFADALFKAYKRGVDLSTVTIDLSACGSYFYALNLYNILYEKGVRKLPNIWTTAGFETQFGVIAEINDTVATNSLAALFNYVKSNNKTSLTALDFFKARSEVRSSNATLFLSGTEFVNAKYREELIELSKDKKEKSAKTFTRYPENWADITFRGYNIDFSELPTLPEGVSELTTTKNKEYLEKRGIEKYSKEGQRIINKRENWRIVLGLFFPGVRDKFIREHTDQDYQAVSQRLDSVISVVSNSEELIKSIIKKIPTMNLIQKLIAFAIIINPFSSKAKKARKALADAHTAQNLSKSKNVIETQTQKWKQEEYSEDKVMFALKQRGVNIIPAYLENFLNDLIYNSDHENLSPEQWAWKITDAFINKIYLENFDLPEDIEKDLLEMNCGDLKEYLEVIKELLKIDKNINIHIIHKDLYRLATMGIYSNILISVFKPYYTGEIKLKDLKRNIDKVDVLMKYFREYMVDDFSGNYWFQDDNNNLLEKNKTLVERVYKIGKDLDRFLKKEGINIERGDIFCEGICGVLQHAFVGDITDEYILENIEKYLKEKRDLSELIEIIDDKNIADKENKKQQLIQKYSNYKYASYFVDKIEDINSFLDSDVKKLFLETLLPLIQDFEKEDISHLTKAIETLLNSDSKNVETELLYSIQSMKSINILHKENLDFLFEKNFKVEDSYSAMLFLDLLLADIKIEDIRASKENSNNLRKLFNSLSKNEIYHFALENDALALNIFLNPVFQEKYKSESYLIQYRSAIKIGRFMELTGTISDFTKQNLSKILPYAIETLSEILEKSGEKVFIGKRTKIILANNDEKRNGKPRFNSSIYIKLLNAMGISKEDEIKNYLSEYNNITKDSMKNFCNEIVEFGLDDTHDNLLVVLNGHGGEGKWYYSGNDYIEVDEIAQAIESMIEKMRKKRDKNGKRKYTEEDIKKKVESITIDLSCCHSYVTAKILKQNLKDRNIKYCPQMLAEAGRETIFGYTIYDHDTGNMEYAIAEHFNIDKYLKKKGSAGGQTEYIEQITFRDIFYSDIHSSNHTIFMVDDSVRNLLQEFQMSVKLLEVEGGEYKKNLSEIDVANKEILLNTTVIPSDFVDAYSEMMNKNVKQDVEGSNVGEQKWINRLIENIGKFLGFGYQTYIEDEVDVEDFSSVELQTETTKKWLKEKAKQIVLKNPERFKTEEDKNKFIETFRFTPRGIFMGVCHEMLPFWKIFSVDRVIFGKRIKIKSFIEEHENPTMAQKIAIWVIRALSIGFGIGTGVVVSAALSPFACVLGIPVLFATEFITHLMWNFIAPSIFVKEGIKNSLNNIQNYNNEEKDKIIQDAIKFINTNKNKENKKEILYLLLKPFVDAYTNSFSEEQTGLIFKEILELIKENSFLSESEKLDLLERTTYLIDSFKIEKQKIFFFDECFNFINKNKNLISTTLRTRILESLMANIRLLDTEQKNELYELVKDKIDEKSSLYEYEKTSLLLKLFLQRKYFDEEKQREIDNRINSSLVNKTLSTFDIIKILNILPNDEFKKLDIKLKENVINTAINKLSEETGAKRIKLLEVLFAKKEILNNKQKNNLTNNSIEFLNNSEFKGENLNDLLGIVYENIDLFSEEEQKIIKDKIESEKEFYFKSFISTKIGKCTYSPIFSKIKNIAGNVLNKYKVLNLRDILPQDNQTDKDYRQIFQAYKQLETENLKALKLLMNLSSKTDLIDIKKALENMFVYYRDDLTIDFPKVEFLRLIIKAFFEQDNINITKQKDLHNYDIETMSKEYSKNKFKNITINDLINVIHQTSIQDFKKRMYRINYDTIPTDDSVFIRNVSKDGYINPEINKLLSKIKTLSGVMTCFDEDTLVTSIIPNDSHGTTIFVNTDDIKRGISFSFYNSLDNRSIMIEKILKHFGFDVKRQGPLLSAKLDKNSGLTEDTDLAEKLDLLLKTFYLFSNTRYALSGVDDYIKKYIQAVDNNLQEEITSKYIDSQLYDVFDDFYDSIRKGEAFNTKDKLDNILRQLGLPEIPNDESVIYEEPQDGIKFLGQLGINKYFNAVIDRAFSEGRIIIKNENLVRNTEYNEMVNIKSLLERRNNPIQNESSLRQGSIIDELNKQNEQIFKLETKAKVGLLEYQTGYLQLSTGEYLFIKVLKNPVNGMIRYASAELVTSNGRFSLDTKELINTISKEGYRIHKNPRGKSRKERKTFKDELTFKEDLDNFANISKPGRLLGLSKIASVLGKVVFDSQKVDEQSILFKEYLNPEDMEGTLKAKGIVLTSGMELSHQGLIVKEKGILATIITGVQFIERDGKKLAEIKYMEYSGASQTIDGIEVEEGVEKKIIVSEGDEIAIDGDTGRVIIFEKDVVNGTSKDEAKIKQYKKYKSMETTISKVEEGTVEQEEESQQQIQTQQIYENIENIEEYIKSFAEFANKAYFGTKSTNLQEMSNMIEEMKKFGIDGRVPYGVMIGYGAFLQILQKKRDFKNLYAQYNKAIENGNLKVANNKAQKIIEIINNLNQNDLNDLRNVVNNYIDINGLYAIRSAFIGEDGKKFSSAGVGESIVGVQGDYVVDNLINVVLRSMFSERSVAYQCSNKQAFLPSALVQEVVDSKKSAVMMVRDGKLIISGSFGQGEIVVSGKKIQSTIEIEFDENRISDYIAGKIRFDEDGNLDGENGILDYITQRQDYEYGLNGEVRQISSEDSTREIFSLEDIYKMFRAGLYLKNKYGYDADIELAFDENGALNILQIRPITEKTGFEKIKKDLKTLDQTEEYQAEQKDQLITTKNKEYLKKIDAEENGKLSEDEQETEENMSEKEQQVQEQTEKKVSEFTTEINPKIDTLISISWMSLKGSQQNRAEKIANNLNNFIREEGSNIVGDIGAVQYAIMDSINVSRDDEHIIETIKNFLLGKIDIKNMQVIVKTNIPRLVEEIQNLPTNDDVKSYIIKKIENLQIIQGRICLIIAKELIRQHKDLTLNDLVDFFNGPLNNDNILELFDKNSSLALRIYNIGKELGRFVSDENIFINDNISDIIIKILSNYLSGNSGIEDDAEMIESIKVFLRVKFKGAFSSSASNQSPAPLINTINLFASMKKSGIDLLYNGNFHYYIKKYGGSYSTYDDFCKNIREGKYKTKTNKLKDLIFTSVSEKYRKLKQWAGFSLGIAEYRDEKTGKDLSVAPAISKLFNLMMWPDYHEIYGNRLKGDTDNHMKHMISDCKRTGKKIFLFVPPEIFGLKSEEIKERSNKFFENNQDLQQYQRTASAYGFGVTTEEIMWFSQHPENLKYVEFVFGSYDYMNVPSEEFYEENKLGDIDNLAEFYQKLLVQGKGEQTQQLQQEEQTAQQEGQSEEVEYKTIMDLVKVGLNPISNLIDFIKQFFADQTELKGNIILVKKGQDIIGGIPQDITKIDYEIRKESNDKSESKDKLRGKAIGIINGRTIRVYKKDNNIIFYSNHEEGLDGIEEIEIENLFIETFSSGIKNNIVNPESVVAFARGTDRTTKEIIDRMEIARKAGIIKAETEIKFDLRNEIFSINKCEGEYKSTGANTFIITQDQAKTNLTEIATLKQKGYRFVLYCEVDNIPGVIEFDGLQIDATTSITTKEQAISLLTKLKKMCNVEKTISIEFSKKVYELLKEDDIDIFKDYGVLPTVNSDSVAIVNGKKEINKILETTDIDSILRDSDIVSVVADKDSRNIFSVIKDMLKIKTSKYEKGLNVGLREVQDENNRYSLDDILKLKDILFKGNIEFKDISLLSSILTDEDLSYLNYLLEKEKDKENKEESFGFVMGRAMRTMKQQWQIKFTNVDDNLLMKEAKGQYEKSLLLLMLSLQLTGKVNIEELLENSYLERDDKGWNVSAEDMYRILGERATVIITRVLNENDKKIKELSETEIARAKEDFGILNNIIQDRFRTIEESKELKISVMTVRSILAAA